MIAITGSNGKTSTKNFLAAALKVGGWRHENGREFHIMWPASAYDARGNGRRMKLPFGKSG